MSNPIIDIKLDNRRVMAGLDHMDPAVERSVDAELGAIAQGAAVEMKTLLTINRSIARSTLLQSINAVKVGARHWFVGPSVNYGRAVEEGTGPAVGRASYMPNPQFLEDYVRQNRGDGRGIKMAGKPGSTARRQVLDKIRDRAWGLAVHIRKFGTKPHPFVAPTADKVRISAPPRVMAAVERGLQEAFRA